MIERVVVYLIVTVVLLSVAASYLPRVASSLVALGLIACIARLVWWYTR
jgi:hypothetical protein